MVMSVSGNGHQTAYRTCPLCEATCGLEIKLAGDDVASIRGDHEDVFSHGFICPKGFALKELHADPDRIRTPLIRRPDGSFAAASWDEAFASHRRAHVADPRRRSQRGCRVPRQPERPQPLDTMLYGKVLLRALGTRNNYSASTVDQFPKQMASALMFGTGTTVPVPDLDRTEYLLMLGANPLQSNGSLMTAPDMRGRLREMRSRGGKLVVIDPRRTRTAEEADEHYFIRPGTDAHFLFALVHVLFEEGMADPGSRLEQFASGLDEVRRLAEPFTPEAVAEICGIDAGEIRRVATRARGGVRAPRSTAGSAPAPRSSGRSRAGSSTCSTS